MINFLNFSLVPLWKIQKFSYFVKITLSFLYILMIACSRAIEENSPPNMQRIITELVLFGSKPEQMEPTKVITIRAVPMAENFLTYEMAKQIYLLFLAWRLSSTGRKVHPKYKSECIAIKIHIKFQKCSIKTIFFVGPGIFQ